MGFVNFRLDNKLTRVEIRLKINEKEEEFWIHSGTTIL